MGKLSGGGMIEVEPPLRTCTINNCGLFQSLFSGKKLIKD